MQVVRTVAVLSSLVVLPHCVTASPHGNVTPPRISLVGDSWPLIMRFHGGFREALVAEGYRPRQVRNVAVGWSFMGLTETRLAYQGIESYKYLDSDKLERLDRVLARYPTIDIIHLSLGGADIIHELVPELAPPEQERYLRERVIPYIDAVLSYLEETYPDKHIALIGYDFLNFRDTRLQNKRTERRWEKLGEPDPITLNELSWRFDQLQAEVVRKHPGVVFISYLGRTKERLGVAPSLWEPTPEEGLWKDGMHLSRKGNADLARYCLDHAYAEWLFPMVDARGRPMVPRLDDRSRHR